MFRPGVFRVIWIAFFGALMAVGAVRFTQPRTALPLAERGPNSSVNSILEATLGEPNLAPRLAEFLAGRPRGRPMLILAEPGNTAAAMTADLVSYLAWPRPAVISSDRARWPDLLSERYDSLALCNVAPPPGPAHVRSFGRGLNFVLFERPAE